MSDYDLTTLADARAYIGLSGGEDDVLLARLIEAATARIERFCNRQFASRDYSSWLDGSGGTRLYLPHRPVTALMRVCLGARGLLEIKNTSSDAAYATARATTTGLVLAVGGGANAGSNTLAWAIYATAAELHDAVEALEKGWQAAVVASRGGFSTTDIRPFGGADALGATATCAVPIEPSGGVEWDEDSGELYRAGGWPSGRRNIFAEYTGGWATIPGDLAQVCIELVKQAYDAIEGDANLSSETADGHYWMAKPANALSAQMTARLWPWRRWSFGAGRIA